MKVTSSYAMHFHIWKPSAPGSTPTGWILLDLTYGDRSCFVLIFLAPDPTREFQAPRHSLLLQAQLINEKFKQTIKYAYNSMQLQYHATASLFVQVVDFEGSSPLKRCMN
jgi:hypothetical protein